VAKKRTPQLLIDEVIGTARDRAESAECSSSGLQAAVAPDALSSIPQFPLDTYRLFFDRTRDIILIIGADGRIIEPNRAALKAYGYDRSEFVELNVSDLRDTSTLESLREEFEIALANEIAFETTHRKRDGTLFDVEVHATSAVIGDERVIMSVIRDITDRKEAEAKLREAERRAAHDYLQLLSRVAPLAHALGTANELVTIYRELRDFVHAEMPCDGFFISFYDNERDERTGAFVWSREDGEIDVSTLPPIPLKGAAGPNARAVSEAKTIVVDDYGAVLAKNRKPVIVGPGDNGLRPRSSVASPMFVMKRVIGTVEVQSYVPSAFTDAHVVALELAASLSAVAIDQFLVKEVLRVSEEQLRNYNETLEENVKQRTAELAAANRDLIMENREREKLQHERADLLSRLVTSQEDERRRIARDLHDHIGQQLTALELKVEFLVQKYAAESGFSEDLKETQEIMQHLNAEVDVLAWQLRPSTLDDHGFILAVQNYIGEWTKRYQINVEFWTEQRSGDQLALRPEAETNLYRIVQEALNNVAKYAEATNVDILIDITEDQLRLVIEDNGVGFADKWTNTGSERRSMGIISMRERAALVGGTFAIESSPNQGTAVFVSIPLKAPAATAG